MNEICEIVLSQKGNVKINVHGYLMVKDQNRGNKYYWRCEKDKLLNCKGRAVTTLTDGKHYLKSFSKHPHAPQASNAPVAKAVAKIKKCACKTREAPTQLIQNNMICISEEVHLYMLSLNALH
jgi:hypothetical protein